MKVLKKLMFALTMVSALGMVGCKSDPEQKQTSDPTTKIVTKSFTQPDFTADANSPSAAWAFITYSLSEFADKDVTIDFSCNIKANNKTANKEHFMWQVNNGGSYPEVAVFDVEPGESTINVSGKNADPITISSNAVLYLSTNNSKYDITFDISDIKYTVSYGGSAEKPEEPAKEYPTDIFVVAEEKIADFSQDLIFDGSQATDITFNKDGTVTYVCDAVGSGRGVVFYINKDKSVINASNYESVDIELVCSPVTGSWKAGAANPGFGFRLYTPEASGFWSGFEDIEYFGLGDQEYGTITKNIKIDETWVANYKDSCDNDDIIGFALKFNAYENGHNDSDKLKVQIKKVQFNKKEGAPADKKTDDGLTDADRGTVLSVTYPSHDYANDDPTEYQKPGWVYLPAGYNDPANADKKYPLVILMHGYGQNQDTWGLTDKGTGGKIKGYMDRGMFSGDVEQFILVAVTGVASKNYAKGDGNDFNGFLAFGGELRNDLIPYMRANYRIAEGRDNVAMAGLSMGAMQTMNIGMGDTLDLISYFGAFSFSAPSAEDMIKKMEKYENADELKVNYFYTICGTNDSVVSWEDYENGMKALDTGWDKLTLGENFSYEKFEGGTHDFPVWYRGFKHFIPYVFK